MTHYDRLIDSVTDTIYKWYITGQMDSKFDEKFAKEDAHKLLTMVEEFQQARSIKSWRATD
jgi:hypothetical protein